MNMEPSSATASTGGWQAALRQAASWQRGLLYVLIFFSSFSIAGVELATFGLLLLGIAHGLRHRNSIDVPPRWVVAPFLALAASALLSALVNPHLWRNLSQLGDLYRLALPFALLPALALVSRRRLLLVYVAVVALVSLYGVAEFQLGVDWFRPEGAKLIRPYRGTNVFHAMGYFTHHLTYAGVMLINAPLFAALAITDRGRVRLWWLAGALFSANAVLLSLGRSGWIGAVVGLGVLLLMLRRRWWLPLIVLALGTSLVLGSLLATGQLRRFADAPHTPAIVVRALDTSLSYDKDRLYLWEAGWLAMQDRPWLGAGIGNEDYDYEVYRQIVSRRHGGYTFVTRASAGIHNIYLQMAFATGIVGLTAYLSLFGALLGWCGLWLRRAGAAHCFERGLLWGVAGALTGFSAASCFNNYFFDDEVANVLLIAMGLALHAGLTIRRDRAGDGTSAPPQTT